MFNVCFSEWKQVQDREAIDQPSRHDHSHPQAGSGTRENNFCTLVDISGHNIFTLFHSFLAWMHVESHFGFLADFERGGGGTNHVVVGPLRPDSVAQF